MKFRGETYINVKDFTFVEKMGDAVVQCLEFFEALRPEKQGGETWTETLTRILAEREELLEIEDKNRCINGWNAYRRGRPLKALPKYVVAATIPTAI